MSYVTVVYTDECTIKNKMTLEHVGNLIRFPKRIQLDFSELFELQWVFFRKQWGNYPLSIHKPYVLKKFVFIVT